VVMDIEEVAPPTVNSRVRGAGSVEQPAVLRPAQQQLSAPIDAVDPLFAEVAKPEPLAVPAVVVNSDGEVEQC